MSKGRRYLVIDAHIGSNEVFGLATLMKGGPDVIFTAPKDQKFRAIGKRSIIWAVVAQKTKNRRATAGIRVTKVESYGNMGGGRKFMS